VAAAEGAAAAVAITEAVLAAERQLNRQKLKMSSFGRGWAVGATAAVRGFHRHQTGPKDGCSVAELPAAENPVDPDPRIGISPRG
jgi:hypothetical protein